MLGHEKLRRLQHLLVVAILPVAEVVERSSLTKAYHEVEESLAAHHFSIAQRPIESALVNTANHCHL